ncbi:hypothetical protein ACFOLF_36025 [Paenibacillus sepulcri]|uniref:Holin n=1 Tax=Paenibacillus sepulcri TaxID=359917 RepID=A0ABS7BZE2_9BACL|nr:hypothetical protein [Paenibacillus sepulcri]
MDKIVVVVLANLLVLALSLNAFRKASPKGRGAFAFIWLYASYTSVAFITGWHMPNAQDIPTAVFGELGNRIDTLLKVKHNSG